MVSLALFAGAVLAGEVNTVYDTVEITITSCAATVTDCPARSTVTSLTSYPASTYASVTPTVLPVSSVIPTLIPASSSVFYNASTPAAPVPTSYPSGSETSAPVVPGGPAETASYSTMTISTCIPTVIYSSVLITPTPSAVSTYVAPAPISTGTVVVPGNTTSPTTPSSPVFTGAASAVKGSLSVAAVAGVVAFFL